MPDHADASPSRRQFLHRAAAAPAVLGLASSAPGGAAPARPFPDIPNVAKLRMHWYIFGPAWTAPEARRQLELMAKASIGGVLIFPTYPIAVDDAARGIHNQDYLSPEFLDVLRHVAADARSLGMTVDIVLGTGWPYGGLGVPLEESAYSLRMARLPAAGEARPPRLQAGEQLIAGYLVDGDSSRPLRAGELLDGARGEMQWFLAVPTRMQVKRAGKGAEGWVLDHYREASLQHFLGRVGSAIVAAPGPGGIRSIFCDSLEVYRASWTPAFPDIFARARGYDLLPHLAALFRSEHPDCADLRCDFWRTLSALAAEAFVEPLTKWAHAAGVTTQIEAYGTPPVSIAAYRHIDVPVGEHYEWKEFNSSRWASSGAHLAAKPVILAEAWTWLGLPNRFADTLEELKLCSDLHFLSGINSLYGTTYAYSPVDLPWPGWVPYFGPAMNHTAPCWPYFGYLADYVNRACSILQQGKPVADVAVYLPVEDAMAEAGMDQLLLNWAVRDRMSSNGPPPEFSLPNALHYESDVIKGIVTNGYALDGVDTFTMDERMTVHAGRLLSGDGSYAAIVLPNLTGIDLEPLRKIEAFVMQGGTAIATRRLPQRAYGLRHRQQRTAEVRDIAARLFGPAAGKDDYTELAHGRGKAIFCPDERGSFRRALASAAQPDIRFAWPSGDVSFVHRKTDDRDFYFVVNTGLEPLQLDGVFRVGHKVPECWDPQRGAIAPLVVFEHVAGGTRVPFSLGPRESKAIVFAAGSRAPAAAQTDPALQFDAAGAARVFENGAFDVLRERGPATIAVNGIPAPFVPRVRWRLRAGAFDGALEELRSWTAMPPLRYFSGLGVYEGEFDAPGAGGLGVMLDLGTVRETADVELNGEHLGVCWMRPYQLDATGALRQGVNRLRIAVTNLAINRILGLGPIDYSETFRQFGKRFFPGDEWSVIRDPFPAGIFGPVRLVYYKTVAAARVAQPEA